MNSNRNASPSSSTPATEWPQTPSSDITRACLDRFRITLYLSLIPQHLIPEHLFTIDPRTGFNLRKSTDRTVQFLHQLEELWDAADYCEEIVLEALVRSVSGRQQQWGGESELRAGDLEKAREMVCRGAMGAWSPTYVLLLSYSFRLRPLSSCYLCHDHHFSPFDMDVWIGSRLIVDTVLQQRDRSRHDRQEFMTRIVVAATQHMDRQHPLRRT